MAGKIYCGEKARAGHGKVWYSENSVAVPSISVRERYRTVWMEYGDG
jgi:hypothetical protein